MPKLFLPYAASTAPVEFLDVPASDSEGMAMGSYKSASDEPGCAALASSTPCAASFDGLFFCLSVRSRGPGEVCCRRSLACVNDSHFLIYRRHTLPKPCAFCSIWPPKTNKLGDGENA